LGGKFLLPKAQLLAASSMAADVLRQQRTRRKIQSRPGFHSASVSLCGGGGGEARFAND